MPKLNRRRLLQMIGAAGLAPALPAVPVGSAVPRAVTPAQMLWAGMHARAGSGPEFIKVARSIGVAPKAARAIYAKLPAARVLAAHGGAQLARPAASASASASMTARRTAKPADLSSARTTWRERLAKLDVEKRDAEAPSETRRTASPAESQDTLSEPPQAPKTHTE